MDRHDGQWGNGLARLGRAAWLGLWQARSNVMIALFCLAALTALDLGYNRMVNPDYAFGPAAFLNRSYWLTGLLILMATFGGRWFLTIFLTTVFVVSVFQITNYEYFGSYILPIHYIQLIPDFMLIMASLHEALAEMIPILTMAGLGLVLVLAVLVPLARRRVVFPRAALLVVAVIVGDMAGKYAFIEANREKLGEPSFRVLFPDVNHLAIHNAYRSARYLLVGILPDRIAGTAPDHPALPEPVALSAPDVNIVVILNEAIRAKSLSVLGYELETTPRLAAIEGLYATSVYSAGTMTRTSFAGFVNRLKYPGMGKQFLSQSNCLFRLAKANGFATHFMYAQDRIVADTLLPFMCPKHIDGIWTTSEAPTEAQSHDNSILHHLNAIDLAQRNFILIGPQGAHTPYEEKSPPEFKLFDEEYDNAIRYTDHVTAEIIDHLRKHSTKPTYVIFTSDHGQLLKGEDERRGHGWFKQEVVVVPFLFLPLNDPAPDQTMAEVRKVQSHFDIATLALGLMGYDVAVEDPARREIFINGSDLSGLAGQLRLELENGDVRAVELINGTEAAPAPAEFAIAPELQPGG